MRALLTLILSVIIVGQLQAQNEVIYKENATGFYQDSILPATIEFSHIKGKKEAGKYLSMDFSRVEFPGEVSDYDAQWHNKPLSQGATGTCWCFSTISFLESEIHRTTGHEIKLSEMYVVYWEYVARAKYFVIHRGDMYFGQGSEANAVTRIIKEYGVVPAAQYTGKKEGQRFHDHGELEREIRAYLDFIKANNIWDEEAVVANVRSILDHHLGPPPAEVIFEQQKMSPLAFMSEVANLVPNDYFCFMSTMSVPYNQKGELVEPDNWWHSDDYYNVNLDDFTSLFKSALDKGYTLSICGDVSEPGYDRFSEVGIIAPFDIPGELIDSHSREFRLNNGTTTDDHCLHVVGYTKLKGATWYLIKDSAAGGFDGPNKGYRFIREDYVKLKFIAVMTHKYAASEVLDRIIK